MKDLLKLTNVTGDEFNMFTKGNQRLIIRGKGSVISVSNEMYTDLINGKYGKFSGHTHPLGSEITPGPADRPFLIKMGQSRSGIWSGESKTPYVFGTTIADDFVPQFTRPTGYYDNFNWGD